MGVYGFRQSLNLVARDSFVEDYRIHFVFAAVERGKTSKVVDSGKFVMALTLPKTSGVLPVMSSHTYRSSVYDVFTHLCYRLRSASHR